MVLAVVFAVASAFSNAISLIAQHLASVTAPGREKGWRLARYLLRQPLWLLGQATGVATFAFQAVALHFGLLSVVQPVLLIELVFVLVLRKLWIGEHVAGAAWTAAGVACVALAVFLSMSEPTGGTASPSAGDWLPAILASAGAVAAATLAGLRGLPLRRAAALAAAAALTWALMATFIKTATQTLAASGLVGMLENWSPYALAATAAAGTLLEQAALHVGPLSVSEPVLVVVNPLASIGLSVWVFDEHFTASPPKIAVAFTAFAVMAGAIIELSRAAPRDIRATRPSARPAEQPGLTGRSDSAGTGSAPPRPATRQRRTRAGSPPAPPGTHRSA
jgi:drug/metabolite transporter (DMT)-like permease